MIGIDKTRGIFDKEIKRKRDLGFLRHACAFPRVLSFWSKSQKRFFDAGGMAQTKNSSLQQLQQSPFCARWGEHTFGVYTHSGLLSQTVELARYAVPMGSIGLLKRLNQWVEGWDIQHWGNPYTGNPTLDLIQWRLQLSPIDDQLGGRWVRPGPALPGEPFADLPFINGLWYLPHAGQGEINAVIPGGYVLRFFALLGLGQNDFDVAGRLCCVSTSEYSSAAAGNVSRWS
jgi:hypothetical protein